MLYLSGCASPAVIASGRPDLGLMLTPKMGNRPDLSVIPWAADTGCFAAPDEYDEGVYLAWLAARPRPLFATAPDVVRNAAATWAKSADVLPKIRALGVPAALVAQDGIEDMAIDWDSFDALFVGGSDAWKLGPRAYEVGIEAKRRGKWLHWGRVNSARRMRQALKAGADSADGTFIAFGPERRFPEVLRWLDFVNAQQHAFAEITA